MNFNELIKSNKQNVKNIIKLITKQENEDLEQEVYIRVLKNAHNYREKGSFKSWISTIASNVSKDYLKSSAYKNSIKSTSDECVLESIKDNRRHPEVTAIESERSRRIIRAIDELPHKLREVIILCEIDGYTYEEASKKLKCPIGTVKSRIYYAKKELAAKLEDLL